ncbi:MAG: UvrD-helicase domain-containing protein, partial [Bacillota bacterium]|nr:UvrD-helicase domain-containing protein [Bacillota bacterium]
MKYIADLHIHSKYSRATSRDCDPLHLDLWARYKGLHLIGTGDFTHAQWRQELREALVPAEEGFYVLKEEQRLAASIGGDAIIPRFVVTGEISSIYKKNGKTRKVHNVIILPSLEDGDQLAKRLEAIGNLHSDGRPILGLDCRDLLEITLETCPRAIFVPAHIWTPHFSLFGAFSGFDTIEECFEDLTPYIHALETGLSSDPPMNRRVSALDRFTLISNSDAHSPMKLAREANLFDGDFSYTAMGRAIETGEHFGGTLEFFPEEGKYHWDGHRTCGRRLSPKETIALDGICPSCGKKITIGVDHRVEELADRDIPIPLDKPFEQLIPLTEIIADTLGGSAASKKTQKEYFQMLEDLGPELEILRSVPLGEIEKSAGLCVARGVEKLRQGQVKLTPGYDGEYGTVSLFTPRELEELRGEQSLFAWEPADAVAEAMAPSAGTKPRKQSSSKGKKAKEEMIAFNQGQQAAITAANPVVAVIAGPGTGKTRTLVERIAYLIETRGVNPREITAVTFTNQAAQEMRERLIQRLGGRKAVQGLAIGTFHRVCLDLLPRKPLLNQGERRDLLRQLCQERGITTSPRVMGEEISRCKNGMAPREDLWDQTFYDAYQRRLSDLGCRDLDDILLEGLKMSPQGLSQFRYLLVDEFQDINDVQHRLVNHWASQGELFV